MMLSFTPDTAQPLRLRDDPPPVTVPSRSSKKRKTPPAVPEGLPPMMHNIPPSLPPGYPYPPSDYSPGGLPQSQQQHIQSPQSQSASRTLSNSKRAEQNRKAQRAFRERRDQHVKALESRSELLDAALASADEANRRWEECRALVDQLRVENAALRAALSQAQAHLIPANINSAPTSSLLVPSTHPDPNPTDSPSDPPKSDPPKV